MKIQWTKDDVGRVVKFKKLSDGLYRPVIIDAQLQETMLDKPMTREQAKQGGLYYGLDR